MKVHQDKETEFNNQLEELERQIKEKQNVIESLMKVNIFLFLLSLYYVTSNETKDDDKNLYTKKNGLRRYHLHIYFIGNFKRRRSFQFEAICKNYSGEWGK